MTNDTSLWQAKRLLIARDPDSINLNAGTLSPTPIPLLERVTELRRQQAANPSDFMWRQSGPLLDRSRAALARYVNCEARDLLLLPNITFAMNIIASSLAFEPGDEILTTDHEYGAMMSCWRHHALRGRYAIRETELPYRTEDPEEIVESFARAIGPRTRALYFSHVTTSTGLVLPAQELCRLARDRGLLTIIDGAHGPGMVPLDLQKLNADFYAANCHKWTMTPVGAGFLRVAAKHKPKLQPIIVSWGHGYDPARAEDRSPDGLGTFWQRNLEFHGTLDRCPQMTIADAIEFRNRELGGDGAIALRVGQLADCAREAFTQHGFTCATPQNPSMRGSLIAFDTRSSDPVVSTNQFWEQCKIEAPTTRAAGRTFLRISTSWFTTEAEIARAADAARQVVEV